MNKPGTPRIEPLPLNLGSSKRLQQLTQKSSSAPQVPVVPSRASTAGLGKQADDEWRWAREQIDRQLAGILSRLPPGRQRSLFKIRFGVELDALKNLPIGRIFEILDLDKRAVSRVKSVAALDYFGREVADRQ